MREKDDNVLGDVILSGNGFVLPHFVFDPVIYNMCNRIIQYIDADHDLSCCTFSDWRDIISDYYVEKGLRISGISYRCTVYNTYRGMFQRFF